MQRSLALVFVFGLAGCSKSEKQAPPPSPCEAAVARGVDQTIAKRRGSDAPALSAEEAEVPKKLKAALATACVNEKWSGEVIECFQTSDDIASCKAMLTPEQRAGYSRAAMGVMTGGGMRGMGGMGAPHGGPGPHGGMGGPGGPGAGGAPGGGAAGSGAPGGAPEGNGSAGNGAAGAAGAGSAAPSD